MSLTQPVESSMVLSGLGTVLFTVVTAGVYMCEVKSTIPLASALSIVVNQNGSPVVSNTSPSATQQSMGAAIEITCAASDAITVVLSSANAVDGLPNSVKSVINFFLYK